MQDYHEAQRWPCWEHSAASPALGAMPGGGTGGYGQEACPLAEGTAKVLTMTQDKGLTD